MALVGPASGHTVRDAGGVRVVVSRVLDAPVEQVWAVLTSRTGRAIGSWAGDPASGAVQLSFVEGGEPEEVRIARCEELVRLDVVLASPDGPWPLSVRLEPGRITLVHELAEPYDGTSIGPGWEYYLDRLAAEVAGEPLPSAFAPYLEHGAAYALP